MDNLQAVKDVERDMFAEWNQKNGQTPIEVLLQVGEDGKVSARNIYEFLGMNMANFSRWCKSNIVENEFAAENEDYYEVFIKEDLVMPGGGAYKRESTDYRCSVPFAKKLCMISRTERGEQARDYFVKVEDALKNVARSLPALTANELILKLAQSNVEMEREMLAIKGQVAAIEQMNAERDQKLNNALKVFSRPNPENWKVEMRTIIREIADTYQVNEDWIYRRAYRDLEIEYSADLGDRFRNLAKRLIKQGARRKDVDRLTKLDAIDVNKELRAPFEGIVRKYQAEFAARGEHRDGEAI